MSELTCDQGLARASNDWPQIGQYQNGENAKDETVVSFIVTSSNVPEHPLHFQFRRGDVTIPEVFTLLAALPRIQVNTQSAVSVTWPLVAYGNQKHSSNR